MGRVNVPGFQTKALMEQPIGGSNFGIIPSNCMVDLASKFRQGRGLTFCKEIVFCDVPENQTDS